MSAEHCPECGRTFTYAGALGCGSRAAPCQHRWHCRKPEHRVLAHPMELKPPLNSGFNRGTASVPLSTGSTPRP